MSEETDVGRVVTLGCVGDVHARVERLEAALAWLEEREPAALLLTGDFAAGLPAPDRSDFQRCIERLEALPTPFLFVPGNHDRPGIPHPGNVDRRRTTVEGLRVFGLGGSPRTPAHLPYEWDDEAMGDLEVPECDVLLAHAPPAETELDRMRDGRHIGSRTIRRIAEGLRGALVCGHVHESVAAQVVGSCLCYNAGSLGPPHAGLHAGTLTWTPATRTWRVEHRDLEEGHSWSEELVLPPDAE